MQYQPSVQHTFNAYAVASKNFLYTYCLSTNTILVHITELFAWPIYSLWDTQSTFEYLQLMSVKTLQLVLYEYVLTASIDTFVTQTAAIGKSQHNVFLFFSNPQSWCWSNFTVSLLTDWKILVILMIQLTAVSTRLNGSVVSMGMTL